MKMPLRGAATLLLLCTLLLGACGQSTTTTPAADATAPAAEAPTTAAEAPTTAAEAPTTAAEATVAPTTASGGATGGGATIRIGSKNFTEVLIVAELQALLLEN